MSLQSFLRDVDVKGANKFFIFFEDEDGNLQNICYQSRIFFKIIEKRSVRFINPNSAINTIKKIKNRELKAIGSGHYAKNIDFINDIN